MAELGTGAANDLLNELVLLMVEYGADATEAKGKLYLMLHDYQIVRVSTDMTVYTGDVNSDYLKRFLMTKTVAGLSKRTLQYYRRTIEKALPVIGKNADAITPDDIRYYIALRMRGGVKKVTINNELRCLSSMFTWMADCEIIRHNPITKIDKLRTPREQKKAFTSMEIERMRAVINNTHDRALFEVMLSTGCRVSEVCGMRISDLNEDGSIVVHGKGDKYRTVYMNARAQVAITAFLKERCDCVPYLFPKSVVQAAKGRSRGIVKEWWKYPEMIVDGQRDNGAIENRIRTIGRRAGVENAHPHRFRRTCATNALNKGMPLTLVSKMLGHASVSTTQIYLDINDEELRQAHRKYID